MDADIKNLSFDESTFDGLFNTSNEITPEVNVSTSNSGDDFIDDNVLNINPLQQPIQQISENVENNLQQPKKRGRKPKNSNETTTKEKTTINIDQLSVDDYEFIFKNYSKIPASTIMTKFNITKRGLNKLMSSIRESIDSAYAHGDIDKTKYDNMQKYFEPFVQKPQDNLNLFCQKIIDDIKK